MPLLSLLFKPNLFAFLPGASVAPMDQLKSLDCALVGSNFLGDTADQCAVEVLPLKIIAETRQKA